MAKLVVAVLVVLAAVSYGMLFVSWNAAPVAVVGLWWSGQSYWQTAPLAYVPLVGMGIGAVIVAFLWLCQWVSQRSRVRKLSAQVGKAREVLDFQKRRIAELEKSLGQAQREKEEAQRARASAVATPAPAEAAPAAPEAGRAGDEGVVLSVDLAPEGGAEDPEVI